MAKNKEQPEQYVVVSPVLVPGVAELEVGNIVTEPEFRANWRSLLGGRYIRPRAELEAEAAAAASTEDSSEGGGSSADADKTPDPGQPGGDSNT